MRENLTGRAIRRAPVVASGAAIAAFALILAGAGAAFGDADPLKGGTTTLAMQLPGGVKVSGAGGATKAAKKTVVLPITGGSEDPVAGTGEVDNGGTVTLKKGHKKVTLSSVKTTFGAPGQITAQVGNGAKTLATLSGGTVGRAGFGGTVDGATTALTKSGAKALNKALGLKKGKGFKSGKSLGTASTSTVPKTVQVLSGTQDSFAAAGLDKLLVLTTPVVSQGKGVDPTIGGIQASDGATFAGGPITSPVTGGSIAPDASAGLVHTQGTLKITKTTALGGTCPEDAAHFPVGNFFQLANTSNDFSNGVVLANVTIQAPLVTTPVTGPVLFGTQIPEAAIDMSGATVTSDPATRTVTITGIKAVDNSQTNVDLLSGTFGTSAQTCGTAGTTFPPGTDPALNDTFVTQNLTLHTH